MILSKEIQFSQPLRGVLLTRSHEGDSKDDEAEPTSDRMDEAVREAQTEAYARGFEDGRAAEATARERDREAMRRELDEILSSFQRERDGLVTELEALLPQYILEGVGRMLYAMEPDAKAVSRIVRELLHGRDEKDHPMRLTLNSRDAGLLEEIDPALFERFPNLNLIRDDSLHSGECLLESRFGIADARYSAKLANLQKVLS